MKPRLLAALLIVLAALTVAAAVYSVVANFPRGLILAVLLIAAAGLAWYGLLRADFRRVVALVTAAVLALAAIVVVIVDSGVRIARAHPGASPSTTMPDSMLGTVREVFAIAAGRQGN